MPGPMQLVLILVIVILLFGTKRLKNIGADLGNAFKGFKKAINDDEAKPDAEETKPKESISKDNNGSIIEGEVIKEKEKDK